MSRETTAAEQSEALESLLELLATNSPTLAEAAEVIWRSPAAYADGELDSRLHDALGDDADSDAVLLLRLGVALGVEYEQAYPTGDRGRWPVSPEARPDDSEGDT